MERDFVYAQALSSRLPKRDIDGIDIGSEVKLSHLRTEKTAEGSFSLDQGDGELKAIYSGKGPQHVPDQEQLSTIIEVLNERFGLDLTEKDQLLFDQFEEDWAANPEVVDRARNNEFENFKWVFNRDFLPTIVGVMDSNEEIVTRILNDKELERVLADFYAQRLYERLRSTG